MHIDASSLCLLLAVAVLSYLLGYLAGQMHFRDSPTGDGQFPQAPEDLCSETTKLDRFWLEFFRGDSPAGRSGEQ